MRYCVVTVETISEHLKYLEDLRAIVASFLSSSCPVCESVNYVGSRIYASHSWLSCPLAVEQCTMYSGQIDISIEYGWIQVLKKISRIRETLNLSTDADSSNNALYIYIHIFFWRFNFLFKEVQKKQFFLGVAVTFFWGFQFYF